MQTTDSSNLWRAEAELKLEDARKQKSERTKDVGSPITVPGKPLDIVIENNYAWCAESTAIARKIDLETGKTMQTYKGHTGPVTCLCLYSDLKNPTESHRLPLLITGSWDNSIKLWNTKTREVVSTTSAHSDFLKALLVVPELKLLISTSADKRVKFWDFENPWGAKPLYLLGTLPVQQRPVQCLAIDVHTNASATLITADTMGLIKVWGLERGYGEARSFRSTAIAELRGHRTGINDMWYAHGELWTGSTDETAQLQYYPTATVEGGTSNIPPRSLPIITHPKTVKALLPLSHTELEEPYLITACGELIRTYDVSSPLEPELLSIVDAHWHDVTALRLWMRTSLTEGGKKRVEPWVISTSLDGTLRKWRIADLLKPPKQKPLEQVAQDVAKVKTKDQPKLTEEEERELAELMDSD